MIGKKYRKVEMWISKEDIKLLDKYRKIMRKISRESEKLESIVDKIKWKPLEFILRELYLIVEWVNFRAMVISEVAYRSLKEEFEYRQSGKEKEENE